MEFLKKIITNIITENFKNWRICYIERFHYKNWFNRRYFIYNNLLSVHTQHCNQKILKIRQTAFTLFNRIKYSLVTNASTCAIKYFTDSISVLKNHSCQSKHDVNMSNLCQSLLSNWSCHSKRTNPVSKCSTRRERRPKIHNTKSKNNATKLDLHYLHKIIDFIIYYLKIVQFNLGKLLHASLKSRGWLLHLLRQLVFDFLEHFGSRGFWSICFFSCSQDKRNTHDFEGLSQLLGTAGFFGRRKFKFTRISTPGNNFFANKLKHRGEWHDFLTRL